MSATVEQLEARVAFLERELRRTTVIIDHLEARTDTRLAEINQHLDTQDVTYHNFAQSVDKRFEHVYGQLADINANTLEIRNLLASLVEKQK